jgi:Uma2 family endonuclease
MSVVAEKTMLTPEELLRMPERKRFELVDGELVERKMSVLSGWVGGRVARIIGDYVEVDQLGWVFPADTGVQCFPDRPKSVRFPDVCFVKTGRMGWEEIAEGWLQIVPDLVVEIISPNDLAYEIDEKVVLFLKVRTSLIWVVNPVVRTVYIFSGGRFVGFPPRTGCALG